MDTRTFLKSDGTTFLTRGDNPNFPDFDVKKELIHKNKLILKVFSLMITVEEI